MPQVAVQLPDDLNRFVQKSVESGAYHDTDEFFVSMIATFKEQIEASLTTEEETKLTALRADIQLAVDQADRGEVIRGFDVDGFLAERHRSFAERQRACPNAAS